MQEATPAFSDESGTWNVIRVLTERASAGGILGLIRTCLRWLVEQMGQGSVRPEYPVVQAKFKEHWPELAGFLSELESAPASSYKAYERRVPAFSADEEIPTLLRGLKGRRITELFVRAVFESSPREAKQVLGLAALLMVSLGAMALGVAKVGGYIANHQTPDSEVVALESKLAQQEQQVAELQQRTDVLAGELSRSLPVSVVMSEFTSNRIAQALRDSNSDLQALNRRLQSDLAFVVRNTNALAALPPDQVNLTSIIPDLQSPRPPRTNDWVLFVPTTGEVADLPMEFGVPYRVTGFANSTNVELKAGSRPNSPPFWIHDWGSSTNYATLRIPTNGLTIPRWLFQTNQFLTNQSPVPRPAPPTLLPPSGLRVAP